MRIHRKNGDLETYYRNKPHTYPDLIAADKTLPGIEIKTAILKNSPKGHQPKGTSIGSKYKRGMALREAVLITAVFPESLSVLL